MSIGVNLNRIVGLSVGISIAGYLNISAKIKIDDIVLYFNGNLLKMIKRFCFLTQLLCYIGIRAW